MGVFWLLHQVGVTWDMHFEKRVLLNISCFVQKLVLLFNVLRQHFINLEITIWPEIKLAIELDKLLVWSGVDEIFFFTFYKFFHIRLINLLLYRLIKKSAYVNYDRLNYDCDQFCLAIKIHFRNSFIVLDSDYKMK